jgi:large subunit ribosomal protein L25
MCILMSNGGISMEAIVLEAEQRTDMRHGETRRIRRRGDIPAIVYGKNQEPKPVIIDGVQFRKLHVGSHGLLRLKIKGGRDIHAMIQDVQRNPITREVIHIDLHSVSLSEPVEAGVTVVLNGLEAVEKRGGIVQQQVREIRIRCLPTQVPEHIAVDISHLDIGDRVVCSEIQIPEGIELRSDPDEVIVNVISTRAGETGQNPEDATPGVLEDQDNKGVASDGLETATKA